MASIVKQTSLKKSGAARSGGVSKAEEKIVLQALIFAFIDGDETAVWDIIEHVSPTNAKPIHDLVLQLPRWLVERMFSTTANVAVAIRHLAKLTSSTPQKAELELSCVGFPIPQDAKKDGGDETPGSSSKTESVPKAIVPNLAVNESGNDVLCASEPVNGDVDAKQIADTPPSPTVPIGSDMEDGDMKEDGHDSLEELRILVQARGEEVASAKEELEGAEVDLVASKETAAEIDAVKFHLLADQRHRRAINKFQAALKALQNKIGTSCSVEDGALMVPSPRVADQEMQVPQEVIPVPKTPIFGGADIAGKETLPLPADFASMTAHLKGFMQLGMDGMSNQISRDITAQIRDEVRPLREDLKLVINKVEAQEKETKAMRKSLTEEIETREGDKKLADERHSNIQSELDEMRSRIDNLATGDSKEKTYLFGRSLVPQSPRDGVDPTSYGLRVPPRSGIRLRRRES